MQLTLLTWCLSWQRMAVVLLISSLIQLAAAETCTLGNPGFDAVDGDGHPIGWWLDWNPQGQVRWEQVPDGATGPALSLATVGGAAQAALATTPTGVPEPGSVLRAQVRIQGLGLTKVALAWVPHNAAGQQIGWYPVVDVVGTVPPDAGWTAVAGRIPAAPGTVTGFFQIMADGVGVVAVDELAVLPPGPAADAAMQDLPLLLNGDGARARDPAGRQLFAWQVLWNPTNAVQLQRDTSVFRSAPAAIRLEVTGGGEGSAAVGLARVPAPGSIVGVSVRAEPGVTFAGCFLETRHAGRADPVATMVMDLTNRTDRLHWRRIEGFLPTVAQPPDGALLGPAEQASLLIIVKGAGTVWVDDVTIRPSGGLLVNPDMELVDDDGTDSRILGWQLVWNPDAAFALERDTQQPGQGTTALRLRGRGTSAGRGTAAAELARLPRTGALISLRCRREAGVQTARLALATAAGGGAAPVFHDLADLAATLPADGAWHRILAVMPGGVTTVAPAQLQVMGQGTGSLWVDDVLVDEAVERLPVVLDGHFNDPDSPPFAWSVTWNPAGSLTFARDAGSGAWFAQLAEDRGGQQPHAVLGTPCLRLPDDRARLRLRARRLGANGDGRITLSCTKRDGTVYDRSVVEFNQDLPHQRSGWSTVEGRLLVPEGTVSAKLLVHLHGNLRVYLDDLEILPAPPKDPEPPRLLNATFKDPLTDAQGVATWIGGERDADIAKSKPGSLRLDGRASPATTAQRLTHGHPDPLILAFQVRAEGAITGSTIAVRTAAGSQRLLDLGPLVPSDGQWHRVKTFLPPTLSPPTIEVTAVGGVLWLDDALLFPPSGTQTAAATAVSEIDPWTPVNGAFSEEADEATRLPPGWSLEEKAGVVHLVRDDRTFASAPAAMRFESVGGYGEAITTQPIERVPADGSVLRFQARASGSFKQAQVGLWTCDDQWQQTGWLQVSDLLLDVPRDGAWYPVESVLRIPPGSKRGILSIEFQGDGKFWFDDLQLSPASGSVSTMWLVNGDFTVGSSKPQGWVLGGEPSGTLTIKRDTQEYHSKPAALALVAGSTSRQAAGFIRTRLRALPPDGAVLRYAVRRTGIAKRAELCLWTADAKFAQTGWQVLVDLAREIPDDGNWYAGEAALPIPAGSIAGELQVHVEGTGTIWLDDLAIAVADAKSSTTDTEAATPGTSTPAATPAATEAPR